MLILASTVTDFVLISTFASLIFVSVSLTSFAVGLNIYVIAAEIKRYKSIIKKKKKYDKILFLGKDMLNTIDLLISKALIDSCITHDNFFLSK